MKLLKPATLALGLTLAGAASANAKEQSFCDSAYPELEACEQAWAFGANLGSREDLDDGREKCDSEYPASEDPDLNYVCRLSLDKVRRALREAPLDDSCVSQHASDAPALAACHYGREVYRPDLSAEDAEGICEKKYPGDDLSRLRESCREAFQTRDAEESRGAGETKPDDTSTTPSAGQFFSPDQFCQSTLFSEELYLQLACELGREQGGRKHENVPGLTSDTEIMNEFCQWRETFRDDQAGGQIHELCDETPGDTTSEIRTQILEAFRAGVNMERAMSPLPSLSSP